MLTTLEYICKTFDAQIEDKAFAKDVSLVISVLEEKEQQFVKDIKNKLGINVKLDVTERTFR